MNGTSEQRVPDFFLVGAPKCGTTSLFHWLRQHPGLHLPAKEPGYFSRDLAPVPLNNLDDYLRIFAGAGDAQLIGEASPRYLYSIRGLREIRELNPQVRLIVSLRHPVTLLQSYHAQMVRQGVEARVDLRAAWTQSLHARESSLGSDRDPLLNYPFWGSIGQALEALLEEFSRDRVHLTFLEDIQREPGASYRDILHFLGLEDDGFNAFSVENPRRALRSPRYHRLLLSLRHKLRPLLPKSTSGAKPRGTGVLRALSSWNEVADQYQSELDDALRGELQRFFAEDVETIERLTGRTLDMSV